MQLLTLSSIVLPIAVIPSVVGGGFYFLTRYQYSGVYDCNLSKMVGTCHCRYLPEHRLGYAPFNKLNCKTFMNDGYFEELLTEKSWDQYPSICGSKSLEMRLKNKNKTMEVWEKNAKPRKLLAKCKMPKNAKNATKVRCKNGGDPVCLAGYTEVTYQWKCNTTKLC